MRVCEASRFVLCIWFKLSSSLCLKFNIHGGRCCSMWNLYGYTWMVKMDDAYRSGIVGQCELPHVMKRVTIITM
ncbi:hypothetical protein F5Y18DRAFT_409755 [Xylariaceae sp. FL1019]|nr:hypothetical protein F5Y18DRAFT_409755 [Xylariaceae sp. FL1019]